MQRRASWRPRRLTRPRRATRECRSRPTASFASRCSNAIETSRARAARSTCASRHRCAGAKSCATCASIPEAKVMIRDTTSDVGGVDAGGELQAANRIRDRASTRRSATCSANSCTAIRPQDFERPAFAPVVNYPFGHIVVERDRAAHAVGAARQRRHARRAHRAGAGFARAKPWRAALAGRNDSVWSKLLRGAVTQRIPVRTSAVDRAVHTGVHHPRARRAARQLADAVRGEGRAVGPAAKTSRRPGRSRSSKSPTSASMLVSARPTAPCGSLARTTGYRVLGATVTLYDTPELCSRRRRTDARGVARFARWKVPPPADSAQRRRSRRRMATATSRSRSATIARWRRSRRTTPTSRRGDSTSSPAWAEDRLPVAGAVFTERGIYRPGERVYAKAIVRDGLLGALQRSGRRRFLRWQFKDREGIARCRKRRSHCRRSARRRNRSRFRRTPAVGDYGVEIQVQRQGKWRTVGSGQISRRRISAARVSGERRLRHRRTHFPATPSPSPCRRAISSARRWGARSSAGRARVRRCRRGISTSRAPTVGTSAKPTIGGKRTRERRPGQFANGSDTLDARGERTLRVALPALAKGRAASVTV